ncbi:hypothetical protein AA313_de0208184 [Arthrobotrys entomopaga]|nr:hypothetical protein AA313_de0208184 [Arthrobotrys entomopaga]
MALCSDGGGTQKDTDLDVQVSEGTMEKLAQNHNMSTWDIHFDDDDYRATYLLDVNPHWVNRLRGHSANLIDARWIDKKTGLFIDITALSETHPIQRPGMINCKNLHRYNINDIWPLRDVKFENITARVPWAYDKILIKEYRGKAFTATEFEKHEWQPALQSWVPKASAAPTEIYTLKNGKTIKIKREDPRGLETVPLPTFYETLSRAIQYW